MKIQNITWESTSPDQRLRLLKRPGQSQSQELSNQVKSIIDQVKQGKDKTLFELTSKYDRVSLSSLSISPEEMKVAYQELPQKTLEALKESIKRVSLFHKA